ncbi:MAG: hypothetical protein L0Y64_17495, partial [Myxococcaceae bacterium]|nr:hypothetical protein [Myxococcaceae bacterium]
MTPAHAHASESESDASTLVPLYPLGSHESPPSLHSSSVLPRPVRWAGLWKARAQHWRHGYYALLSVTEGQSRLRQEAEEQSKWWGRLAGQYADERDEAEALV